MDQVIAFGPLGIRSSLKEDVGCTSAELVYGVPLRLPGSFFTHSATSDPAPTHDYIDQLKTTMSKLRAVPPRTPTQRLVYVNPDLFEQTHVFVRHDAVRSPLQPPYDGPFRVISRTKKHFAIDIRGRQEIVSIDRLKPAHLDAPPVKPATMPAPTTSTTPTSPPSTSPVRPPALDVTSPPVTTRSGRRVHFPLRLTM